MASRRLTALLALVIVAPASSADAPINISAMRKHSTFKLEFIAKGLARKQDWRVLSHHVSGCRRIWKREGRCSGFIALRPPEPPDVGCEIVFRYRQPTKGSASVVRTKTSTYCTAIY